MPIGVMMGTFVTVKVVWVADCLQERTNIHTRNTLWTIKLPEVPMMMAVA